jgi:hypothetical protein
MAMLRRDRSRKSRSSDPAMAAWPGRLMRITSAPWSASIIAQKGAGPIPANSTTRSPCNDPVTRELPDQRVRSSAAK